MTQRMLKVMQRYTQTYKPTLDRYVHVNKQNVNTGKALQALQVITVPFMTNILNRYTEEDFHAAMSRQYYDEEGKPCFGFDFIGDWRSHHPLGFNAGLQITRMYRKSLQFDIDIATNLICDIIRSWEWHLSFSERMSIRHLLYRIKRLVNS